MLYECDLSVLEHREKGVRDTFSRTCSGKPYLFSPSPLLLTLSLSLQDKLSVSFSLLSPLVN